MICWHQLKDISIGISGILAIYISQKFEAAWLSLNLTIM